MLNSLSEVQKIKSSKDINKKYLWLIYLYTTREKNYNLNNLKAISELTNKSVLNYVIKALTVLNNEKLDNKLLFYVEETLKWMEVAKCGSKKMRNIWLKNGYDLYVHNIGSAQIYKEMADNYDKNVEVLIKTHGLIGQHIKGEVNLDKNKILFTI